MSMRQRAGVRWLVLLAGLPLLYLPLRAAESPAPAATEPPAAGPPADATPPAEAAQPAPKEGQAPAPAGAAEEQVSLDSNLSFPVDI